ncbi:MAG TPA: dUTP diphosphatase [Methylophaga sp.]|nr:dUTP diphosphatase [Methylophaga sp.]
MKVKIKLLYKDTKVPSYGRSGDAGLDLYSREKVVLQPGQRHSFKLGFALELPSDMVALMWDRSGMATKFGIHSMAGVIDSNYRGEVNVLLHNTSDQNYTIEVGDKIAQMLIQKYQSAQLEVVDELPDSERGDKGWFSSGK